MNSKNQPEDLEFLTISQVAEILQVSYDTVRKLLDAETIPADGWIRIGKQIRIRRSAIINL